MLEDDASRDFLERLLAVFQEDWDRLEEAIDGVHRHFDPEMAPPERLDWLSSWIGTSFPSQLGTAQRRQALESLTRIAMAPPREVTGPDGKLTHRGGGARGGTARHLREHLAVVLASLAGRSTDEMRGFPWVIEGFRERACRTLGGVRPSPDGKSPEQKFVGESLRPPEAPVLWGPDATGRLQLGVNSVLGERTLLPPVRPELDLYAAYAHRFRVVAPACWASTPSDVASLCAAIEQEKPAHTAYELTLVQPGLRIGLQSTVGIDTILGGWPPRAELSSTAPTTGLDQGVALAGIGAGSPLRVGDPLKAAEL
jgi:hypothetical protein